MLVSLRNMRKITMDIPDGLGNRVSISAGEEKVVEGDIEYFKSFVRNGLTGLVVKVAEAGGRRLVEEKSKKDIARCLITNKRKLPFAAISLGTGSSIDLGAGETKEVIARVSLLKQNTGISVKVLEMLGGVPPSNIPPRLPPNNPIGSTPKSPLPAAKVHPSALNKVRVSVPPPTAAPIQPASLTPVKETSIPVPGPASVTAIPEAAPPVDGSGVKREMGLPGSLVEFDAITPQLTMPDIRGIARRLGLTGRGRQALLDGIRSLLYETGTSA